MDIEFGKILNIAKELKISSNYIEFIAEYLDHGEWGLAFEALCSAIEQQNIQVSLVNYTIIEQIGKNMEMDKDLWEVFKIQ